MIISLAPSDYISVSQVLTFSSSSIAQAVQVPIVNDSVLELSEAFTASISLAEDSDDTHFIELMPNSVSATIIIIDDDGTIIMAILILYKINQCSIIL